MRHLISSRLLADNGTLNLNTNHSRMPPAHIKLLGNPLLPNYDSDEWYEGSESVRRAYWQALLLLSVGLSMLLGAFLFLGLMLRRCPPSAAGAAAAALSLLALVLLLSSARAVQAPQYE